MAAYEEKPKVTSAECEPQCVISQVEALPLVSSACERVSATYSSAKESHPAIQAVCDMAESGVKTVATSAASSTQPLLDRLEPQIAAANSYASKGLDKLQETLPVLQQTVEKVVLETKDLVAGAKDSICSRVTEVKDVMSSMVDVAKETAQESMEMAKSVVSSGVNTVVETGRAMVAGGACKVLDKSEELVDHYLPVTDEELASLAASLQLEGSGIAPVEEQKQGHSYYLQLGSLSTTLRNRAYQHALGKLQNAKQNSQEALLQLQQAVDLIKYAKQAVDEKIHDGQEKLQEMWRVWSKSQLLEQRETDGKSQLEMESQALGLSRSLAQKLQVLCQDLLASVQGLPVTLQEKVKQTYSGVEELQVTFSSARSFRDISSSLLAQSEEKMDKAREALEELLEYVVGNTPLTWVVGPFSPAGTSTEKPTEPEEEVKMDA